MVHKNRRKVKGLGCVEEFKEDCGNLELGGGINEYIGCLKSRIVVLNEPQEMARILVVD